MTNKEFYVTVNGFNTVVILDGKYMTLPTTQYFNLPTDKEGHVTLPEMPDNKNLFQVDINVEPLPGVKITDDNRGSFQLRGFKTDNVEKGIEKMLSLIKEGTKVASCKRQESKIISHNRIKYFLYFK